jgi:hypothetical protein
MATPVYVRGDRLSGQTRLERWLPDGRRLVLTCRSQEYRQLQRQQRDSRCDCAPYRLRHLATCPCDP